ncbi:MAG TPA: sulfocyanin-like copper-binding protein [Candidatus Binatia bacterium]|nr:sulfocyanin-like copper-binding protein [Candidatus Binatia bacterium]
MSLILIAILAVAFYVAAISVLVFRLQPPLISSSYVQTKNPSIYITLYAGETSSGRLGFGDSSTNLSSPGPTLRLKISDVVSLTLVNVGKMPHAFAVASMPTASGRVLFNAKIASATNPLEPGQSGTVVFAPDNAGTFYYICPVPGHSDSGMYGAVVVTG